MGDVIQFSHEPQIEMICVVCATRWEMAPISGTRDSHIHCPGCFAQGSTIRTGQPNEEEE